MSPRTSVRLQECREKPRLQVFLRVRSLTELQNATKGRRSRASRGGSRGQGGGPSLRAPTAPFLSLLFALVLAAMEDAEVDCAVAFAEAQRWVEVSAFPPLLSARAWRAARGEGDPGHCLPGTATGAWRLAGLHAQFWGTLQVLPLLSLNVLGTLSAVLPSTVSQASAELLCQGAMARWSTWDRGPLILGNQPTKAAGRPGILSAGQGRPRVLGCVSLGWLEWMPDTYLHGQSIECVLCG